MYLAENGRKIEIKNGVKSGYREHPGSENNQNGLKM